MDSYYEPWSSKDYMSEQRGQWEQRNQGCCLYYEHVCERLNILKTKNPSGSRWVATSKPVHVFTLMIPEVPEKIFCNARNMCCGPRPGRACRDRVVTDRYRLPKYLRRWKLSKQDEEGNSESANGRYMGPGEMSHEGLSHYPCGHTVGRWNCSHCHGVLNIWSPYHLLPGYSGCSGTRLGQSWTWEAWIMEGKS